MRTWHTDGSLDADSRHSPAFKWFISRAPNWLARFAFAVRRVWRAV